MIAWKNVSPEENILCGHSSLVRTSLGRFERTCKLVHVLGFLQKITYGFVTWFLGQHRLLSYLRYVRTKKRAN